MTDTDQPVSERSPRDLSWGSPQLAPANCYGEHDPVALDEQVVCAACGAEAETANPEDWPDADEELRSLLADDSLRADGGPEQAATEQFDTINEFTIAGEFGFQRVPGPFEVEKDGTIWGIVVPEDAHPTVSTLHGQEGEAAVVVADGRVVGGGIVTDVVEIEEHDELHILVDQYPGGGTP